MQIRLTTIHALYAVALLCLFGGNVCAQPAAPASQAAPAIPEAQLLQPAELARMLSSPDSGKPLILQVGSRVLYAEAHIPGSEYAGAAGQQAGLQALRDRVRDLKHDQFIVIYCGCCPWTKCPNIRAAYQQMVSLGFTHVKALYIADNFGANWMDKGYPVEKGR
ncbi:MAG TPA: rhodanese-like domain-containing protein [Bryobacteraceae bacterium]|nr:rhodanese-like domain-containing protein [Bryobacteraceae bacterium]